MKILLLIILMSYGFGGISEMPVTQKVVASSEEAAILLWEKQQSVSYPEPESYRVHLYEIDLGEMTVKEIYIPKISFQQGNPADTESTMTESVQQPEIKFCEVCGTPIGCH